MASSEGLTRRKNAGVARRPSFDNADNDDFEEGNYANGQRRSVEEDSNSEPVDMTPYRPHLTLMDELFLLGLKDIGHLSFWNDSISYVLRACILLELIFRQRIRFALNPKNQPLPISLRRVEVSPAAAGSTDEFLLDEAIRIMKNSGEVLSLSSWVAYLNGETWNPSKLGYQLKMVRERIAKGLVEKGVLKYEKKAIAAIFEINAYVPRNYATKRDLMAMVRSVLVAPSEMALGALNYRGPPEQTPFLRLRCLLLVLAAHTAEVLDNILDDSQLDPAMGRAENLLVDLATFPPPPRFLSMLGITQENHTTFLPYLELISGVVSAMKNA